MVTEHFHTRFSVRVVCRLEAKTFDTYVKVTICVNISQDLCVLTHLREKFVQHSHQVSQSQIIVCNRALYLMKLSQMCGIKCLVTKDTINGEVFHGLELLLLA